MSKSKYFALSVWKEANPKDYVVAHRKGFINDICDYYGWRKPVPNKSPEYWNKVRCISEAKKHRLICEWKEYGAGSFQIALKNGWLNECVKEKKHGTK